jgi:hypothetical protein
LGLNREHYRQRFTDWYGRESQLFKDSLGHVLTNLVRKKIQANDFSNAPVG